MEFIKGDILTPNCEADNLVIVCHQVNCKGVMGAGLAKQIRDKYPGLYENYRGKCQQIAVGVGGLGEAQFCMVGEDGFIVANLFAQFGYGRDKQYTDYEALRAALHKVSVAFPGKTVRIPYGMGCGLGGGSWDIVENIVRQELENNGMTVEVWVLPSQWNIAQPEPAVQKDSDGNWYTDGSNGKITNDRQGRHYGSAIDRMAQMEQEIKELKARVEAAEGCIGAVEDALNRGSDNDYAREAIEEYYKQYK